MSLCLSVYVCPGIVLFCVPNIYISTITHSDTSSDQLAEPGSNLLCIYLCIVGMNPNGMAHTHTPQNARRTGTRTGASVRHVEPW